VTDYRAFLETKRLAAAPSGFTAAPATINPHLCPFSLDLVRRCVELWSNPGDVVLDPFAGVGSVGVVAIERGRRFLGTELKASYFGTAARNLRQAEAKASAPTLFDMARVG